MYAKIDLEMLDSFLFRPAFDRNLSYFNNSLVSRTYVVQYITIISIETDSHDLSKGWHWCCICSGLSVGPLRGYIFNEFIIVL